MSKPNTKFCADCKHIHTMLSGPHRCIHPSLAEIDLVTGPYIEEVTCESFRAGDCGKDAKFFERRKSIAERLVDWIMS